MVFRRSICYDSFTNWDEKIKGGDTLTKEDMKQISDLMDEKFVAFEGRMDFFENWIQNNLKKGLPSRNINTTTPYLMICNLLNALGKPEYEKMCLDQAEWLMHDLPKTRDIEIQRRQSKSIYQLRKLYLRHAIQS